MTIKKAIGFLLVAIPFLVVIVFDVYENGWDELFSLAVVTIAITAIVAGIKMLLE
jgi:hypothetical protein